MGLDIIVGRRRRPVKTGVVTKLGTKIKFAHGIRFPSFRRNHRVSMAVEFAHIAKKNPSRDFTPLFCSQRHKNLPLFTFDDQKRSTVSRSWTRNVFAVKKKHNKAETGWKHFIMMPYLLASATRRSPNVVQRWKISNKKKQPKTGLMIFYTAIFLFRYLRGQNQLLLFGKV